jgi:tRNA modification GTPase
MAESADRLGHDPSDLVTINARHASALAQASECLAAAASKLAGPEQMELVASDLRGVLDAFGEITGRIDNERMLDKLFATFCIGK